MTKSFAWQLSKHRKWRRNTYTIQQTKESIRRKSEEIRIEITLLGSMTKKHKLNRYSNSTSYIPKIPVIRLYLTLACCRRWDWRHVSRISSANQISARRSERRCLLPPNAVAPALDTQQNTSFRWPTNHVGIENPVLLVKNGRLSVLHVFNSFHINVTITGISRSCDINPSCHHLSFYTFLHRFVKCLCRTLCACSKIHVMLGVISKNKVGFC